MNFTQKAYPSTSEMKTMTHSNLVLYAQSLSIPADTNWTREQIISVIEYYRKSKSYGLPSLCTFIMLCLAAMAVPQTQSLLTGCSSGMCDLDSDEDFTAQTESSSRSFHDSEDISNAVEGVLDEFVTAVKDSKRHTLQMHDSLKESLVIAEEALAKCTEQSRQTDEHLLKCKARISQDL